MRHLRNINLREFVRQSAIFMYGTSATFTKERNKRFVFIYLALVRVSKSPIEEGIHIIK